MQKLYLLALTILILVSCGNTKKGTKKLNVVVTTGMIADMVKNIGKDSIKITALMGTGVDPHLYKATQGDLTKLQQADIIFYNGLHLEGKMGELFEKLEHTKTVIPISRFLNPSELLEDPSFPENYDPHIWFDVSLWLKITDNIAQELSKKSQIHTDFFKENATQYKSKLVRLHQWVKQKISSIQKTKRVLITAHDAFGYFGRAYDIEVKGLQGISTLSEFGLRDRIDLVNFIVNRKIKAVFVETSVSEKNIHSIVESCKQKKHIISIGGSLFSDAMGESDRPEGTYIGMVKSNVNTIVNSLK